jgi:hypothetical protein
MMMVKQHSLLYPGDFGKLGKFRKLEKEKWIVSLSCLGLLAFVLKLTIIERLGCLARLLNLGWRLQD